MIAPFRRATPVAQERGPYRRRITSDHADTPKRPPADTFPPLPLFECGLGFHVAFSHSSLATEFDPAFLIDSNAFDPN